MFRSYLIFAAVSALVLPRICGTKRCACVTSPRVLMVKPTGLARSPITDPCKSWQHTCAKIKLKTIIMQKAEKMVSKVKTELADYVENFFCSSIYRDLPKHLWNTVLIGNLHNFYFIFKPLDLVPSGAWLRPASGSAKPQ